MSPGPADRPPVLRFLALFAGLLAAALGLAALSSAGEPGAAADRRHEQSAAPGEPGVGDADSH
jgi:hypothetical protein